jgi:branched-chain amino acid transport system substrate-binding protein
MTTMLAQASIDACSAASYARPSNAGIVARQRARQARQRKSRIVGGTMQRRWLSASALLIGLALVVGACAGGTGGGGTAGGDKGEIIIATNFPVSGADRASGRPAEAGAQYAVSLSPTIKGFKISYKSYDDAVNGVHDPQKGAQNFNDMVANTKILGVVGPFNSNVARATIPIANRAGLVMISPANTNECLTVDVPASNCDPKPQALRPNATNTYFRIAAPDTVQGPAMADFAYDTLKITKIAIWSDNETFGKGVANNFETRFKAKGGQVVVRQDFDTKTTNDFKPFLQRAKEGGALGIYAGATSATKGCIPRAQSKGIIDVPYLGPDGIGDTQCISDAGDQASNMYFTNAAADAAQDTSNKETIDAFKKAFPAAEDSGAYTFPAYDCAKILLDAISRAIDAAGGNMPTRAQVTKAVQDTKALKLTTGTYSFNAAGDPTSATMAFYELKNKVWTFNKQFSVGG